MSQFLIKYEDTKKVLCHTQIKVLGRKETELGKIHDVNKHILSWGCYETCVY